MGLNLADDGFPNDALRRLSAKFISATALAIARNRVAQPPSDIHSNDVIIARHNGVIRSSRMSHAVRLLWLIWGVRRLQSDVQRFLRSKWPNVRHHRRSSHETGPIGAIGVESVKEFGRYACSPCLSLCSSLGDGGYTANVTWGAHSRNRYTSDDIKDFREQRDWETCHYPSAYQKIRYAQQSFNAGRYGFPQYTYFYELL